MYLHSSPTINIFPQNTHHLAHSIQFKTLISFFLHHQIHTDQPSCQTHDNMSFDFLHKMQISDNLLASSHMTTFTDCIATTVSISPYCPLEHKNTIGRMKGDFFSKVNIIDLQTSSDTT